jgi:Leucine-rich repeat (LRR) protein
MTAAGDDSVAGFTVDETPLTDHGRELTDDILWGDCPEELYLQQILREQHPDEGTITDSIMGQSTVAGIFAGKNNEEVSSKVEGGDGRSWTNFHPMAGSVATEGTISVESSPSFVTEGETLVPSSSLPRLWDKNNVHQYPPPNATEEEGRDRRVPITMNPRFLNFDEESSTTYLPERHIPDIVDMMEDPYDEEATEIDATRAGMSTLSGDTGLRYIQPGFDYTPWWINAEDITYAKPDDTRTTKSSRQESSSSSGNARIRSNSKRRRDNDAVSQTTETPPREGFFSWVLRRLTEDDKVFRRTVVVSVLFIFLFVSLSAVALARSSGFVTVSSASEPTSSPIQGPFAGQQSQPVAASTARPSVDTNYVVSVPTLSPSVSLQPPNQEVTVSPPISSPATRAPNVFVDPFRFVADLLYQESPVSIRALGDQRSPQYRALRWSADDLQGSPDLSEERILQRWTLAVFFFSLGGEAWLSRDGWLTRENECLWFSSSPDDESICDELGRLKRIVLEGNNLQGGLPDELGLLSDSLTEVNVSKNQVSGSIPTYFGTLTSLRHLSMSQNDLVGPIPLELTKIYSLSKFCWCMFSSTSE